ncbi:MAG: PKD domain-containing protein [Bacteroidetes bacterium]|nr:PKD domain-containing protein [Bacteroidota bacterium]
MKKLLLALLAATISSLAFAQPSANFSASPQTGCPPMVVSFTDKSTGSPTSWSWTFTGGSPSSSTTKNPTISYSAPGTYPVSLKVSNASGSNTKTVSGYITVWNTPTVSLPTTPILVCPGSPVSLSASVSWNAPGTGNYYWDFGDGGSSTAASPTHNYSFGGASYTIKLTVTNSVGCPTTDTALNLISIYPSPFISFYATDTTICSLGGNTTFISTTTGATPLSFSWDFGDGNSGTGSPSTHTYAALGSYSVTLAVTDSRGCKDSLKRLNYIHERSVTAASNVPTSVCQNSSLVVNSVSPTTNGAVISWDFGDGTSRVWSDTATHIYYASGTFNVKMYATVGGCTDTISKSVTVLPAPNALFSFSPQFPCPAPSIVSFAAAGGSLPSYSWDYGDGFFGTGANTTHTYANNGKFAVKLTAQLGVCSSTKTDTVTIFSGALTILDYPMLGCFPYLAKLHDTVWQPDLSPLLYYPYPFPIISRTWHFGDGSTAYNIARPNHTYYNPGTYYCILSTTTSNGCNFNDTLDVHVGGHSTIKFGAVPNPVCAGNSIQFHDSSSSTYGPITGWYWDFGDNLNSSIIQNPPNIYALADTYSVTLVVSQNGCLDTFTKKDYVVVMDPSSRPRFKVSCDTIGLVHFVDSSINATSIKWYFGDGSTSTLHYPNHQYATPGTYYASLVAWNSYTGCRDSQFFAVIINNISVDMSALDSTLCFNDTIVLSPVITGFIANPSISIGSIKWGYGLMGMAPSKGNLYSPGRFIASFRGQVNIGVWVEDNNHCVVSKIRNNFITVGGPIAKMSAHPPIGCAPANIQFNDSSYYAAGTSRTSAYWDFGDGTNATTPFLSIGHFYPKVGSYGISLKVTDNIGCWDSIGIPNYMLISRPIASFATLGTAACAGTPYSFYNASTGNNLSYAWDFGDGTTSTLTNPKHMYTVPGTYAVRLIAIDGVGCMDTMVISGGVTVAPKPKAGFTMDDTINVCPPLIVHFTNTSTGAVSYNWDFANGISSTFPNPSATYLKPGIYYIRLIALSNKRCPDTVYNRVRLLGYNGVLSYAPLKGCAPLTVQVQANNVPGVSGFIYDFGDGVTTPSTSPSITHVYTQPGPHVPKVTMTDNLGCATVSYGLDTVKVDGVFPGFTFTPFPGCDSGTIQFIDTSRGAYSQLNPVIWRFHDSTISTLASPSKHYPRPGHYPIAQYCSTTTGCKDTFLSEVVFYQRPGIFAGVDTIICLSDSVMLLPRGGVSYAWSPTSSLSCGLCTNPFASPIVPTTYLVVGTDSNGCSNTDSVHIGLKYKTVTLLRAPSEMCSGDTIQFFAEGAGVYHWSPDTGLSNADTSSPLVFPIESHQYVLVSRLAGCIPDTDFVNLAVHPTPTVEAGDNQTMIAGNTVQLQATATGAISSWLWQPPEGLWSPFTAATTASPKRTTVYSITVSTQYGCHATDSLRIKVLCDNSQVFLPNTFTPDGNGVNDIFYPRGKGLANIEHFRIYNRWGELVFERSNIAVDDKSNGWDGTQAGRPLSPDVYVYTVEATCYTGEPIQWQGNVMLLR